MSESIKNVNLQYENIIDWLKKNLVCNVDETINHDDTVSIVNTSYFEDFKIGILLHIRNNDVGRVEIISSPRLLTEDSKVL